MPQYALGERKQSFWHIACQKLGAQLWPVAHEVAQCARCIGTRLAVRVAEAGYERRHARIEVRIKLCRMESSIADSEAGEFADGRLLVCTAACKQRKQLSHNVVELI